ncbi:MAG: VTT domain-containing protein [Terriglobia bacterium]
MDQVLHLLDRYGYAIIFASVFLEALGLPIPSFPFLLAAGAASALGSMNIAVVLLTAAVAMLAGDTILYIVGRRSGWWILGFLCKVSASPETCILRSAESFYKRGRITLVVAKYIPGINTMAPPLAGSLRMKLRQFLGLDLLGSLLYIVPFLAVGYFFSRGIERVVNGIHSLGQIFLWLFFLVLLGYAVHRFRIYSKNQLYREVPRVSVQQLAEKLSDPNWSKTILIADSRSHGYYEDGARRIKGSTRIEPASISEQLEKLPRDKEIYLYCT